MDTTSDELTKPIGIVRPAEAGRLKRNLSPAIAAFCAVLLVGSIGFATLFGDPLGGRPHVRVAIAPAPNRPAPPTSAVPAEAPQRESGDAPEVGRSTAQAIEVASGVSVVRGDGSAAPKSMIVRVPDNIAEPLRPANDPRFIERTRFGPLPRIAPDGAKPLDVYARPLSDLPSGERPLGRVAVVVGGLGISQTATAEALAKLPPEVSLAFAPYGPDLDAVSARARAGGHETVLQVPMEPFDYPDSDPGPHTMTAAAKSGENIEHLQWAMGRITGYVGVMNYMGGKLTSDLNALAPIMKEVGSRGLAFIDDGSSSRSLVVSAAGSTRAARAAVLIDASPRPDQVDKALEKLEAAAQSTGFAIGTASALPVSIDRITRWSRGLADRGILLVPVSYAFRSRPAPPTAAR